MEINPKMFRNHLGGSWSAYAKKHEVPTNREAVIIWPESYGENACLGSQTASGPAQRRVNQYSNLMGRPWSN